MTRSVSKLASTLASVLALAAWSAPAPAQSATAASAVAHATCIPAWNSFGSSDQLPSTVHSSIRAADGFVYIGGRDGLYRVEGGTARAWTPNFSDPEALPAGRIEALAQFDGALWVGTAAGLVRMDLNSERMTRISLPVSARNKQNVLALMAHEDTLLIGTNDSVYALSTGSDGRAVRVPALDDQPFKSVSDFAVHNTSILIATDRGLFRYSAQAPLEPIEIPSGQDAVLDLATDPNGQVWAVTPDRLLVPSPKSVEEWRAFGRDSLTGLPNDVFTALSFDQAGHLWLGSRDGLSRSTNEGESFVACRRSVDANRDEGFSVGHLNADLGPYLFLGSFGRGATVAPLETNIRRIVPGESFNPGLPQAPIWSTAKLTSGHLLLGTTQGLFIEREVNTGAFEGLASEQLGSSRIFAIAPRQSELWVGTNTGLFRISPDGTARKVSLLRDSNGIVEPRVFAIAHTQASVLLGTSSGLVVINRETATPTQFYRTQAEHSALKGAITRDLDGNRVWSIDVNGEEVLATGDTGTWVIDLATATILASTDEAIAQGRFNAGRIYSILDAGDGRVLLGTEAGLVETTRTFDSFRNVTEINGMVLKSVMTTGRADDGRLWLGVAGSGLFHRMPGDEAWQHMSQADGLITNGISQLGLSFSDDGSVIASNATGASIIAPEAIGTRAPNRFHLQASEVLRGEAIRQNATFAVGPDRRDMRIRFAVPELLAPEEYRVDYTLILGEQVVQRADVPLGEDLIFPRLEPGHYRLVGTLASASGEQSEHLTLSLRVDPFWWERQSTYVWIFILAAAFMVALFYFRARSIERKFQIIADERRRIAQELHDSSLQDLFGAQMLGRALKIDGSQDGAQGQKDQVLGLLKSATASMRESVMTLREDPDTPTLKKAISEFSPPAALSQPVDIQYSEDGAKWGVGKHRRFFVARIAQEAITNAAKHARASKIRTRLNWSFWNLTLEVADDGEGFDPSSPDYRAGHGRDAMQCMAEAVSGKLEVLSRPGEGTRIRLSVPRFAL